jgi:hypothetical protein
VSDQRSGAGEAGDTHAVVDRIVEGTAVLLVGDDETEAQVDATALPPGVGEGAWLTVRMKGDDIAIVGVDADAAARATARAEAQRDRLRQRSTRFRR